MLPASSLVISLALTVGIELAVAYWRGYRNRYQVLTVVLMNIFTNPTLNLVLWINSIYEFGNAFVLAAVLELLVIVVEAALITFALGFKPKRSLIDSLWFNLSSLSVGTAIYMLIK